MLHKIQVQKLLQHTLGLIVHEGKKNMENINRHFMGARDQSTLNRFLTASPWSLQLLEAKRLALAKEGFPIREGSTGYFLIDDTINEKTGHRMDEVKYHYDSSQGKPVWDHSLVTTHYVNGEAEYPFRLGLYLKKETCEEKGTAKTSVPQEACGLAPREVQAAYKT